MRNHASDATRPEPRRAAGVSTAAMALLLPLTTLAASGGWPPDIEGRITRAIDGSGIRVSWKSKVECTQTICEAELTGEDPNPETVDWMTELTERLPLTEWGVKQLSMVIREKSPGVRVSVLRLSNETPHPQTTVVSDP
jgi:hypothetical protein